MTRKKMVIWEAEQCPFCEQYHTNIKAIVLKNARKILKEHKVPTKMIKEICG